MSEDRKEPLLPHKPVPALLEAFRYIDEMPGKNVRGTLIDCFQLWMKVESSDVLNSIKVRERERVACLWLSDLHLVPFSWVRANTVIDVSPLLGYCRGSSQRLADDRRHRRQ